MDKQNVLAIISVLYIHIILHTFFLYKYDNVLIFQLHLHQDYDLLETVHRRKYL